MGKLIVITGTPGTGKTSLAMELEKFGFRRIPREILEKSKIGRDVELDTDIVDEELLKENIKEFLEENEGIFVFDSHLSHLAPKEYVILYVLLRCDPNVLKKRLEERGWDPIKVMLNVMAENYEIIKKELEDMGVKFLEFWTDREDVKEIAKKILEIVNDMKIQ